MARKLMTRALLAAAVTLTAAACGEIDEGRGLSDTAFLEPSPVPTTPMVFPSATVTGAASRTDTSAATVIADSAIKARQQGSAVATVSTSTMADGTSVATSGTVKSTYRPSFAAQVDYDKVLVNGKDQGSMHAVIDASGLYLKPPGQEAWTKVNGSDVGAAPGVDFAQQIARAADPTVTTRTLAAAKGIRADGREQVDGVETTRYVGQLKARDAVEAQLGKKKAQELITRMGAGADDDILFTVWIDDQGLARKVVTKQTGTTATTSTALIGGYGSDVTITPPPADQIREAPMTGSPAPTATGSPSTGPSSIAPSSVEPSSVAPSSIAPSSVEPTSIAPSSVAPPVTSGAPAPRMSAIPVPPGN